MRKIIKSKTKRLILVVVCLLIGIPYTQATDEEIVLVKTVETPNPMDHGWFGWPLDMDGDLMVISEWRAEVDDMIEVDNQRQLRSESTPPGDTVPEFTTVGLLIALLVIGIGIIEITRKRK